METPSVQPTEQAPSQPSEKINIKIVAQDGQEIQFKVSKTTHLRKLFETFSQRLGVTMAAFRFQFDGEAIEIKDNTVDDLGLIEGDQIDAMTAQTGG